MEALLPLQVGAAAIENTGMALMVGALACKQFVAASSPSCAKQGQIKLSRLFATSAIVTLIASVFTFWIAVASMADTTLRDALPMIGLTAATTQVGHAWLTSVVVLGLLIGLSRVDIVHRRSWPFLWVAMFVSMLSRSAASHAAAADNANVAILIDAVHFLATSFWLGIVVVAAFCVLPLLTKPAMASSLSEFALFASFLSRTATYALVAVLLTGIYKTWGGLGAMSDFISTAYGNILAAKLALVALATALGGMNRYVVMPSLGNNAATPTQKAMNAQRYFIFVLRTESGILLLVILAASLLSFTSPISN